MIKRICFLLSLLMCGVLYAQDITYRTVKDLSYSSSKDPYATERCKLDVYYPENKTGCPVVVWFHGGGLTQGNKSIPGRLKKNGMVVIAVNYRLRGLSGKWKNMGVIRIRYLYPAILQAVI